MRCATCSLSSRCRAFDAAARLRHMITSIAAATETRNAPTTVCVLRYRDFCSDPAETLRRAVSHAGFPTTLFRCRQSIEKVWRAKERYRYNKGVNGRGQVYFSPAHLARLRKQLSYYPQLADWHSELLENHGQETGQKADSCAA